MTNYTENPGSVRVDYFKESGKWYMTESVDMSGFYNLGTPHEAIEAALRESGRWLPSFTMVVLEPYHRSAYPVMFVAEGS